MRIDIREERELVTWVTGGGCLLFGVGEAVGSVKEPRLGGASRRLSRLSVSSE